MDQHPSQAANKVLLIADNGAGKSGIIGTLANADYRCFVVDFDNGLDILRDPKVLKPEKRKNVYYKTFTDKLTKGVPSGVPQAALEGLKILDGWIENGQNMGSIYTWGPQDVCVIDTLTLLGQAIMRWVLAINNHSGKNPQTQHWGEAMRMQEQILQQLCSDSIKCNVLVNSHIVYIGSDEDLSGQKAYPSALGSKLPPRVGGYFNSVLSLRKRVRGPGQYEIKLLTQATSNLQLKCPRPSVVPPEMDADLAKYFELLKS
jgi:hypothetical protein